MTDKREIEDLLSAAADGALNAPERARLDAHLAAHPEDALRIDDLRRQTALLRAGVPEPDPTRLAALQRSAGTPAPGARTGWQIAAAVALFAAGLGTGIVASQRMVAQPDTLITFANQALAAHGLYVSEVLHPVEVVATQRDHLQTWLSNRLGAAVIAPELGETGFQLIGGRLLPAGDQAAALFMYENQSGDRLSLVVTHGSAGTPQAFRFEQASDMLAVSWQDGPWQYALVGDLPRAPMEAIAQDIYGQLI